MKAIIQTIDSLVEKTVSISRYAGYVCLAAIAGFLCVGVLFRYFFNKPIPFTDELVMQLMIPLVVVPLAYVFKIEGHVRVDIVTRLLQPKLQKYLRKFSEFLTIILLTLMAREFYRYTVICLVEGRRFESMFAWVLWPVWAIGFLGLCLVIIYLSRRFASKLL